VQFYLTSVVVLCIKSFSSM